MGDGVSDELVAELLEKASLSYGDDDWPAKWRRASRIVDLEPAAASANVFAAAIAGNVDRVREILAEDPGAARRPGGPQGWEPLLFACFGRLPTADAAESSVAVARALLDAGGDANAYFTISGEDEEYRYTALTGALGDGELGQPAHPKAQELATLLLERGADANDGQALYNTMLNRDDDQWLALLFDHGLTLDSPMSWKRDTSIGDVLVAHAARRGHGRRLAWLLEHGANANARHSHNPHSAYENALLGGHREIAEQLIDHGAEKTELTGRNAFFSACMFADKAAAAASLAANPEFCDDVDPLVEAAENGRTEVVTLLLELGMDPRRTGAHGKLALNVACNTDAGRSIAEQLLDHGADIHARCYGGTPTKWALLSGRPELARFLAEQSCNVFDVTEAGLCDLLEALLEENPSLARVAREDGATALHCLPEEPRLAERAIAVLLKQGADVRARTKSGRTPAAIAIDRGLDHLCVLLGHPG